MSMNGPCADTKRHPKSPALVGNGQSRLPQSKGGISDNSSAILLLAVAIFRRTFHWFCFLVLRHEGKDE